MIRVLAGIVALALVSGPATATGRAPVVGDRAAIQDLLGVRAAAVTAGREDAFLSTVDPAASGFMASQRSWFERIAAMPIDEYSLTLDEESPELTRGINRQAHTGGVHVLVVEERFRFEGFDERPALGGLIYTFVRSNKGWLISSDQDAEDLGVYSSRQPWDFGDVGATAGEHFIVVFHPADRARVPQLLAAAEDALPGVERVWKQPWSRKVVMFVPSSRTELERLIDATFDVSNFVALATSTVDLDLGWHPVSRVIVNPDNFLGKTRASQVVIFTHELVHVATRGSSGPFVNSAVEEGIAQLAESDPAPKTSSIAPVLRRGFDGSIPEDFDFFSGGGQSIRRAYLAALGVITYMTERFGLEKMNAFYAAYGAARVEPGTSRYHLDRAMRDTLGLSVDEFERDWAAAVRGSAIREGGLSVK